MSAWEAASIWIGAAGSGLVGAVIGGAIAYLTTRQQLRHASSEAKLAREHALKREVYFEAAEGVARGGEYLGGFSDIRLTTQQLSEMLRGNTGWVYKVHAVGDLATIKTLDQANEFLATRSLDLMVARVQLDTLRSAAEAVQERATQLGTHAQQLVAALQAMSAPNATPEARALTPGITQDIRAAQVALTDLIPEHEEATKRRDLAHRNLIVECMKAVAEYDRFLAQANVHVRRELGLPLDTDDYLTHMKQTSDRVQARLKEVLDQFDAE